MKVNDKRAAVKMSMTIGFPESPTAASPLPASLPSNSFFNFSNYALTAGG